MSRLKGKVAAIGIGYAPIERRSARPLASITLDACRLAIADAGLAPDDIDGIATYPEIPVFGNPMTDGVDVVTSQLAARLLGRAGKLTWHCDSDNLIPNALIEAVNAVAAGACEYALVFRAMHNPDKGGGYNAYTSPYASGARQWMLPYGFHRGYQWVGSAYGRYMELYGATPEHMATLILNNRANAARNEYAYFRHQPLTVDDYLDSRILAAPVRLLDCDIPVDGAAAIVLTTAERAKAAPHPAAYVAGYGQWSDTPRAVGPILPELMANCRALGDRLWETTGFGPHNVQAAQLYDGYSFFVYWWLECLGLCPEGEAARFIQDGRIALGGEMPVNTFGGQLGEGRMHGMGHLVEAIRQASGRAGPRQVAGLEACVAAVGPLTSGNAALLFTREP